jgi:hypothetical protein
MATAQSVHNKIGNRQSKIGNALNRQSKIENQK